jgi:hypothetical protein
VGLDKCGVCGGTDACVDCRGLAFGSATPAYCTSLMGFIPASTATYRLELEFLDDQHPDALVYPVINNVPDRSTSVVIAYHTVAVAARNSSSPLGGVVLFEQDIRSISFKKSSDTLVTLVSTPPPPPLYSLVLRV